LHGVLQPLLVREGMDGFELIAGERRLRAAELAGLTEVPVIVHPTSGGRREERLELALVENLQRTDLNAIETARAYKLLMETYDLTQEQLAQLMGTSAPAISRIESGTHVPSLTTLSRLAEAAGERLVIGFERSNAASRKGDRTVVAV